MLQVNYPSKKPSIAVKYGMDKIFCICRKKWVSLKPEEWVRQNFILFLSEVLKYPVSLIAVEKQIKLGPLKKRFDLVVFKNSEPFILIECKEMGVPLSENVLTQALSYYSEIQAKYLLITNGNQTLAFQKNGGKLTEADEIPAFV